MTLTGMGLAAFTVHTSPGDVQAAVNGSPVPVQRVFLDSSPQGVPTLTVWMTGTTEVTGDGVVQVVRDPTPDELDTAAVALIGRVNVEQFTAACEAKVRAGRRDPWRVALETLVEMADG